MFYNIQVGNPGQDSAEMLGFYGEDEVQFDQSPSIDTPSTMAMETSTLQSTPENVVPVSLLCQLPITLKEHDF